MAECSCGQEAHHLRGATLLCDDCLMATGRDCEHGELARSCDQCEDRREIARLTAENKALREACSPEPAYSEPGEYASDGEVYCRECGEPYTVHDGCDPTPECDACAHVVLARLRALAAGGGDR